MVWFHICEIIIIFSSSLDCSYCGITSMVCYAFRVYCSLYLLFGLCNPSFTGCI